MQFEDGKFLTPIEKYGHSRQPEQSEITQVVKKLEKDYIINTIKKYSKMFLLAFFSVKFFEMTQVLGGLWFIVAIMVNTITILEIMHCFLDINVLGHRLDEAREGMFKVVDCKVAGVCPPLSSLSRKEAWELQSVVNAISNDNADMQLIKDLRKKFSKKHRKQVALPYTQFHRTITGMPTTNAIKKYWFANEDADFFIARFEHKDIVMYMDLFAKQLS